MAQKSIIYPEYADVLELHNFIIQHTGGFNGIHNLGLLISPLEAIKDDNFYPEITDKAAFLLFSLVQNHPFTDGNKRTAIGVVSVFLKFNGYSDAAITSFIVLAKILVITIAARHLNLEDVKQIICEWILTASKI